MKDKLLVIRMDSKTHSRFKAQCAASGLTMTDMIMKWINENGVSNEQEKNSLPTVRSRSVNSNGKA